MTSILETLEDCRRMNVTLYGNCSGWDCGHGKALSIDRLIERYGPAYVVIGETRISAVLRCEICGHKGGRLTLAPPGHQRR